MQKPTLRKRAEFLPAFKKITFIAPEELELVIAKVIADTVSVQPDVAVHLVKRFGFSQGTDKARQDRVEAVRRAIGAQEVFLEGSDC